MKRYFLVILTAIHISSIYSIQIAGEIALPSSALLQISDINNQKTTTYAGGETTFGPLNGWYSFTSETNMYLMVQGSLENRQYSPEDGNSYPYANGIYYPSDIINANRVYTNYGENFTTMPGSNPCFAYFRNIACKSMVESFGYAIYAFNHAKLIGSGPVAASLAPSSSKSTVQTFQFYDINNNLLTTSNNKNLSYFAGMVPQTTDNVTTTPILYWPLHLVSLQDNAYNADGSRINFGPNTYTTDHTDTTDPAGGTINYSDELYGVKAYYYYDEEGNLINYTWRPWTKSYFPRTIPAQFTVSLPSSSHTSTNTTPASSSTTKSITPIQQMLSEPYF